MAFKYQKKKKHQDDMNHVKEQGNKKSSNDGDNQN